MKLIAHASPLALEAELLDRVAAAKSGDPLAPVLIVVPSRRLADHVTRRLVERFGAVAGVSVLHHRALAERVMAQAGGDSQELLDDHLLDTLFARVLLRAAAGPLRDFVRDHPGAASALRQTVTDLREAGIDPEQAGTVLSGDEAETAYLYGRWSAALDELAKSGRAIDDAGLATDAAKIGASFGARFKTILHHGAYDLIGVRVELLRALDKGREITFLLPGDPAGPSGVFGIEHARAMAREAPVALTRLQQKAPIAFSHAQGARAELRTAAYEALAAVEAGTTPHEVAVIVRSFGPYAAAMDVLLDDGGPRWHTSYTQPLRRDPASAAALRAIANGPDDGPKRWREHADAFASIAGEKVANGPLASLLECIRELESVLGDDRAVARREAADWIDARAEASTVPPDGADGTGIRILDAMQARGLTFSHLGLAGMNARIFPRISREDPFLSNASRLRLREMTRRPLPIANESGREERLLLAMLLGSASEQVRVSWQRSDEAASPLEASLALTDVAQFAGLDPDTFDVSRDARAIPAHPRSRLSAWAREPGLLDRRDETLLVAMAQETGADAGPEVAIRRPEFAPGIALVAATDSFEPAPGRYDGRIEPPVLRATIAATALERLGRCPLQYFFHDVLRVRAPETPPTPFTEDTRTIGNRVHAVLQRVYEGLLAAHAFERDELPARIERGRLILRDAWDAAGGGDSAERAARLPVLHKIEREAWLRTLDRFLEADLTRLAAAGFVPVAFERTVTKSIPGGPAGVAIDARFDRVLESGDTTVVSDYKTGRKLASRIASTAMLSGKALQVPIYAMIAGAAVELLGVGRDNEPEYVVFKEFKKPGYREGVLETLRVAFALAQAGRFPIRPDDHCKTCDFRSACRTGHPPTEFRNDRAVDIRDARDCWSKSGKAPTLAAVRGGSES